MNKTSLLLHNKQKGLAPILIILLIALAVGGYFIYQKQPKPVSISQPSPSPVVTPVASSSDDLTNWKTYTDIKYRYSVKYPPSLNQQETQNSDTYLSLISFRGGDTNNDWFSIVVRSSNLKEEIKYQKSQIEGHILARLTKETEITIGGFSGALLEYTPDPPDSIEIATRLVITNNGKYSYTISGRPQTLDQILSTFKFN